MQHWLMKTEPGEYAYEDLEREGRTRWDGVRNHQAQNNLKAMQVGDQALIYHSVGPKAVVGIAEVIRTAYPDPTAKPGEKWVVVDVQPVARLKHPVTLAQIKAAPKLSEIALVRQARLSVMPLTPEAYQAIMALSVS